MSMISAQIDGLRKAAQTCRDLGRYETEQMLLDAADTIWQLRDDLQRANAENTKLREEIGAAKNDLSIFSGRIVELDAENAKLQASNEVIAEDHAALCEHNAKLRELVAEMFNACPMCANCAHNHLTVGWYDRMRELGVEVDR